MRIHFSNLEGEFECPPDWHVDTATFQAWLVRRHPSEAVVAIYVWSVERQALGIWSSRDGRFLRSCPQGSCDAQWLRSGSSLLVAINEMAAMPEGGIAYRLQRVAWPSFDMLDECRLGLPQCGIDELVVAPSERVVLACLNSGQGECGYELFSIANGIRRLNLGPLFTMNSMVSSPAFSPSERFVASAEATNDPIWWADQSDHERDWNTPASGGRVTFGNILLHDLQVDKIAKHRVDFTLPQGWLPEDPDSGRWIGPRSPEYLSEDRMRIVLPDDTSVELLLPLPDIITLPAPLPFSANRPG